MAGQPFQQEFAEYYPLGTLSSSLWAILVAKAVLWNPSDLAGSYT